MEKLGAVLILTACAGLAMGGYCPEGEPANPQDVRARGGDVSIFSDLTVEEMDGVLDYMYNRSGLRLATWARSTLNDSFIFVIEALPPKKSDALRYLDHNGPKPQRYAKVILYRGAENNPDIVELKVGPLPKPDSHETLKNKHYKDPIPFHARSPLNDPELRLWIQFMTEQIGRLDPILKPATGGYSYASDCGDKCLEMFPNVPGRWKSGEHTMFINFYKKLDAYYLHPIGLQVLVDAPGADLSKWSIDFIYWRGVNYRSIDRLLEDSERDRVDKDLIPDPEDAHERTLYSSLNFRGDPQPEKPQRGPKSFYPDGRRYRIENRRVSWQGWEFEFGVKTVQGLHVNDISFKGERVVYELSAQELGAFYSGDSPISMHTSFFDTIVLIGRETYNLIPGLDCPEHATFFDAVHYLEGKAFVFEGSVCVFEQDMGIPLRRHYETDHQGGYYWVQGMQDNALILRSMIVAYNYEYMNDIIFHQHGGIETKLTLSGYVLPTFFDARNNDPGAGFEIFPNGKGNIHHHLANFKVDLDILGTENRFETYDIQQEEHHDAVETGEYILGNRFERNLRESEKDALVKPDPSQHLIFFNDKEENAFKNKRGYRLQIVNGAHTLYGDNWRMHRAGACFRYPLVVTAYDDDEQVSSLHYASSDAFDPVMSFEDFWEDDASLVDQDLVAWVTIGAFHIPHSEDVPIVVTQNTQLVFHLSPFNYFDEDPSLASRDNIRVERSTKQKKASGDKNGASQKYDYVTLLSGVPAEVTCVPYSVKVKEVKEAASTSAGPRSVLGSLLLIATMFILAK